MENSVEKKVKEYKALIKTDKDSKDYYHHATSVLLGRGTKLSNKILADKSTIEERLERNAIKSALEARDIVIPTSWGIKVKENEDE